MADIDVGQLSEAINDKMDRDAHNVESPSAVVIESQMPTADNDYTWYRKYSDGWVEQGGTFSGTFGQYTTKTVSLPIEMVNTAYCGFITSYETGTNYTPHISAKTTTTVTFSYVINTTANGATWLVCGKYAI